MSAVKKGMMATLNNVDDSELKVRKVGDIRYIRDKFLGKGSFGFVYEGFFHDKKVAVKRIDCDKYEEIEEKLMTISHSNILRYLDIEKDNDFVYIAMELCAGTLEDLIRNKYKGPTPGSMEEVLLQTALGLEFLHEKRIIHRDIKPMNILVSMASSKDGEKPVMKLADFGLCKQRTDDATSFTNSTNGTPGWAAPEAMMTDDVQRITFSADIFSLGCVFGYALTGGCHPFGDDKYLRPNNVKTGSINWPNEYLIKDIETKKIVWRMISHDPRQRSKLSIVIQLLKTQQSKHMHYCVKLPKHQPLNNELLEALTFCVEEQCDLNLTDEYGRNCVMLMLHHDRRMYEDGQELGKFQKEFLKIFFSDAATPLFDIKHRDQSGENVLHYLCYFYRGDDITQYADLLINLGMDVNERVKSCRATPFELACGRISNNGNLIRSLLERGAKVASCGTNPLHQLVQNYKGIDICDVMQLLIDNGADVKEYVLSEGNALHKLCYRNSHHPMLKEAIAVLIKCGVDINQVDSSGRNALTIVCSIRNQVANTYEVVKLLLQNGSATKSQTRKSSGSKWSEDDALLKLCDHYQDDDLVDIIQTLVENGADINSKTNWEGRNALHLVCKNYENPRLRVVIEYLIEKGIDVNAIDRESHDALYYLRNRSSPINPLELRAIEEAIENKASSLWNRFLRLLF